MVTIATNGIEYEELMFLGESVSSLGVVESGLLKLTLRSNENSEVEWLVKFQ